MKEIIKMASIKALTEDKKEYFYNFDLYKVISTFIIVFLHLGIWPYLTGNSNMQIFVDYFFMLSGVMLARSYQTKKNTPFKYMFQRYKKLYPEYLLFMALYFLLMFIKKRTDFDYWIRKSFLSFLGLQVFGINDYGQNFGAVWYVSVLLLASFLVYSLIYVFRGGGNQQ